MEGEKNNLLNLQLADCTRNEIEACSVTENKASETNAVRERNYEELSFRRKLLLHLIMCYSVFNIGWAVSMMGPAFPDLMGITGVSSGAGSVFVSATFTGLLAGSMFCGFIIDRYDQNLVMACALFGYGSATIAIPLCAVYWAMIIVNGIQGFGCGMTLTGDFTMCGQLWETHGSARSFLQLFQLCFPVGAILSPLVIAPFLSSDSMGEGEVSANMTEQILTINNTLTTNPVLNHSSSSESFRGYRFIDSPSYSNQTTNATNGRRGTQSEDQRLIIPFSLAGAMILIAAALFLVAFCMKLRQSSAKKKSKDLHPNSSNQKHPMPLAVRILRLYLVGQFGCLNKGSENAFIQFFPVFLHSKMGWNKVLSSDIMSVYWGLFAFGRLIGIAISYYMKSSTHLFFDVVLLILSAAVLFVGTHVEMDSFMWISAAAIGLALSTMAPCMVSWCHSEILSRSGKHNSFVVVTNSIGSIILPLVVGNLVELDYVWFVYVILTLSILHMVNLACLVAFVRIKIKPNKVIENIITAE